MDPPFIDAVLQGLVSTMTSPDLATSSATLNADGFSHRRTHSVSDPTSPHRVRHTGTGSACPPSTPKTHAAFTCSVTSPPAARRLHSDHSHLSFDSVRPLMNGDVRASRSRSRNRASSSAQSSPVEEQFVYTLRKVASTIERNETRLAEQEKRDVIKNDWQQVGIVVDRLLLVVFVTVTTGITGYLMLKPPNGWQFFGGTTPDDVTNA